MSKREAGPQDAAEAQLPAAKMSRVHGKKPPKPVAALQQLVKEAEAELHHPTLQYLDSELSRPGVPEWLQSMRGKIMHSLGGYEQYDETNFQNAMKSVGEYTCLLNALEIPPLAVTHRGLVPSLSSCQKVKDTIWARDLPLLWQEVIYVAVFSKKSKPDVLAPLNQDVARLAFWCQVATAVKEGWQDELETAMMSMKVCFKYCMSEESAESEKWRLAGRLDVLSDHAVLRGWRRIVAIVGIKSNLESWSRDSSDASVSAWLAQQKVQVSAEVVKTMGIIRARFQSAGLDDFMESIEAELMQDNPLTGIAVLEKICAFTKADKTDSKTDQTLNNALLTWVVHDLKAAAQNKCITSADNKGKIFQYARCSLLNRRILYYVISKLRISKKEFKKLNSSSISEGDSNTSAHRSVVSFFNNFVSHKAFQDSELNKYVSDKTWLSKVMGFQRQAIECMRLFLDPSPALFTALLNAVEKDPNISAEQCLQDPAWVKLVNLQELMAARQSELEQLAAPITPIPPAPPAVIQDEAAAAIPKENEAESKDAEEHLPDAGEQLVLPDDEPEKPKEPSHVDVLSAELEILHIPEWLMDIFQKVDPGTLTSMLAHAKCRVDTWLRFKVVDEATEKTVADCLQEAVKAILGAPGDKLVVLDGKHFGEGHASQMPTHTMRCFISSLLTPSADPKVAEYLANGTLFLLSDGRNARTNLEMKKELKRGIKPLTGVCNRKGLIELRAVFHMREFGGNGAFVQRARKILHSQLAEPLENWLIVKTKAMTLPVRERRYIDLPGDSSSRCLANVSFKTSEELDHCLVDKALRDEIYEGTLYNSRAGKGVDTSSQPAAPVQSDSEKSESDDDTEKATATGELDSKAVDAGRDWVHLFPTGSSEVFHRELLNLFGATNTNQKRDIVDLAPGSGPLAWAACRESFLYTGVVACEKHATLIQASLRLAIVKELVLNRRDGYQNARYLKKSRSLGSKLDAEMSPFVQSSAATVGATPTLSPAPSESPATSVPAGIPTAPSSLGGIPDDDEDF
ncbi:unnamed protein product [Symbiodinium sp. CCMP2592]|nr:unnamed protein product [Symbiodinium sp. CCMP2592]